MNDHITTLQEKIAFLERHVEELDEQVRELFGHLRVVRDDLDRSRADTTRRLDALRDAVAEGAGEDGPNRATSAGDAGG